VLVAGHRTGDVYYTKRPAGGRAGAAGGRNSDGATVYATNVDTGATREVVKLPPGRNVSSLNADETLLLAVMWTVRHHAHCRPIGCLTRTRVLASPTTKPSARTENP